MRFVLFFVTTVGAIMSVAALVQGDGTDLMVVGPVTAIAGILFWRNLRNPEVTRRNGLRATIHFTFDPGPGVHRKGTFARVHADPRAWNVALDRVPLRGDMEMLERPQKGWVWLNSDGLPEKVKITYHNRWKTWPVTSAAVVPSSQGSLE